MSDKQAEISEAVSGKGVFEQAVDMVEHYKEWIDWNHPAEPIHKPICATSAFLLTHLGDEVPELRDFLLGFRYWETTYQEFFQQYLTISRSIVGDRTAFINKSRLTKKAVEGGRTKYYRSRYIICLTDFMLIHKPCCRLVGMAPLIPAIAGGVPAIAAVSYAAGQFAELINDGESLHCACTSVGNSWLHRLGVYLLHQCRQQSLPPDDSLIRLMSLVSPPPSPSAKRGKANRVSDYLSDCRSDPPQMGFLHEAPPDQAVGTALALELVGEFDANRQGEHYRRVERAVAFYAWSLLKGGPPSTKAMQRASGLSWADAKQLVDRPFFSYLVFEAQCRYLTVKRCPHCEAIRRQLEKEGELQGNEMASWGSSW